MRHCKPLVLAVILTAVTVGSLRGAPPDVPKELTVKPGQLVRITVKTDQEIGSLKNFTDEQAFFGELVSPKGQRQFIFQAPTEGFKNQYVIGWWTKGETEGASTTITVLGGVTPAPDPKPKPDDPPTPAPQGFRVIFVYETSKPVTPVMQTVMFGEKVRNYLDTKTAAGAGGKGWRRFDPDTKIDNEGDAEIKAIWNAARPHVTAVPCVLVAANSKVEILPFPTSEDEALKLFAKYGGN